MFLSGFAGFEPAIGLWAVVLALISPRPSRVAVDLMGADPGNLRHWAVALHCIP